MKQILCFGDSNTYGLIPKEDGRYPWETRWTSILNEKLGLGNYRVQIRNIWTRKGIDCWQMPYKKISEIEENVENE